MERQKTIAKEVFLEGIGLHTGNLSKITFLPAPVNSGIKFVRRDLPDNPEIPANFKNVLSLVRGTTIGNGLTRVHTIEHILAVCSSLGIDNLEIHISNNEPPVLDGSAILFARSMLQGGLEEQNAPRNYFTLSKEIIYESGKTIISARPSDTFTIECVIGYDHPYLKHQEASFQITPGVFLKEIAPARTFCFDYEIEALKNKGLAKGGDLSNAIVVGINGIHNPDKTLRFKDEFVRHKILDLIGDLYLLGMPVKASVKAVRCGHNHNISFVKELAKLVGSSQVAAEKN